MKKRKYTLKRRAEQQQQTRERIVDAAMALHEEVGPAATTISALADRAGVQRLTVYRHFENEDELLGACTSKWLSLNPPPDPAVFESRDPVERIHAFLLALYRYYSKTERMWTRAYHDIEKVPALEVPMSAYSKYLADIAKELAKGLALRNLRQVQTTLGHAVQFATWKSLADLRLSNKAMADLVCIWTNAAGDA